MADPTYLPEDQKAIDDLQTRISTLTGQLPQSYSQAEQAKIMRGRRTQEDKDAGRAIIKARDDQRAREQDRIDTLTGQLGTLKTQSAGRAQQNATNTETAANKAWNQSPIGLGLNAAKVALPGAAGLYAGHKLGAGTDELLTRAFNSGPNELIGLANKLPSTPDVSTLGARALEQGAATAAEGLVPSQGVFPAIARSGAKLLSYGLPAGFLGGEGYMLRQQGDQASDPFTRDMYKMGGTAMMGAGGGVAYEGGRRAFANTLPEGYGPALGRIEAARAALDQADSGSETDAATDAARQAGMREARLSEINKMTVAQMQDELRGKARVSGVKTDLANRVYDLRYGGQDIAESAAANVGKRSGLSRLASAFGPAAIGGGALLAAGAAQDEARAHGATPEEAGIEAAKAGGTFGAGAAAGGYGLSRLAQALSGSAIGRVAGRALGPVAAGFTARDIYNWSQDPATIQAAQVQRDIYGGQRNPGMYAPGDIERRYIDEQTRGPNVTVQDKTSPDAAMLGTAMQSPSKLGYGRQALARALLGQ